jgi:hypothetical protein
VYEVDHPESPLWNVSTRAKTLTSNNGVDTLIGGFIVTGDGPLPVVVAASGPSLAWYGITNPLANPQITVVRSSDQAVIATNNDWSDGSPGSLVLQPMGLAPAHQNEAALFLSLPPGAYTVLVTGVGGGTGTSVVSATAVPQP